MNSWDDFFADEQKQDYFIELMQKVNAAYEKEIVYPPKDEMFSCFALTPYNNIKVVILGQDPYHGKNQAHGLCFSVRPEVVIPPSLKNIYKELQSDLEIVPPNHGYLVSWAKQGVLMMNTSWSVAQGNPASHKKFGWEKFTKRVLDVLNDYDKPLVFLLWGNHAIEAAKNITNKNHLLLKSPHPSPLAGGGFFGTKPFSKTNEFLKSIGRGEIDWSIKNIENIQASKTPIIQNDKTKDKLLGVVKMDGKNTLVVKNKNHLKFLDPFNKAEKEIELIPEEFNIKDIKIIKKDNEFYVIYTVHVNSDKLKYSSEVLLFDGKNIKTVQKTKALAANFKIYDNYLFVLYDTNPTLILKYDIKTLKELLRFEIQKNENLEFEVFEKDELLIMVVKTKDEYMLFNANNGTKI